MVSSHDTRRAVGIGGPGQGKLRLAVAAPLGGVPFTLNLKAARSYSGSFTLRGQVYLKDHTSRHLDFVRNTDRL